MAVGWFQIRAMKLPSGWKLPEQIESRLGEQAGRQRAMMADGHLLLVVHKVPATESREREAVLFWRNPEGDWKSSAGGPGIPALGRMVEEYGAALAKLEAAHDRVQTADDLFKVLEAIAPLHRATKNFHSALQAGRDLIREAFPKARDLIALRDHAGDLDREGELLQIEARNRLDYMIARHGEEQARLSQELSHASHRLNTLAAVFLPLAGLTGIFGMNLPNGLQGAPPVLFWFISLTSILLGLGMLGWLTMHRPAPRGPERGEGTGDRG